MKTPARFVSIALPFLIIALLLRAGPSRAQDATPAPGNPCQVAAAGTWTPWPMGPDMMRTPGAMGPGMMTPGAMGPSMMMDDVDAMVATMLLAHDRVDAALAQAALTRVERPELRQFAEEVAQARTAEGDALQAWREQTYPGAAAMPLDQMLAMMAGMTGPWMQRGPWPGMDAATMGNPIAALCEDSGPADRLFADALFARDQMVLAMVVMMQPTVTDPDLQQFLQDAVADRQQELDLLQAWRQGVAEVASTGTPATINAPGATVEAYDIYFEPTALVIPAGADVTVTLSNEGVTPHNFSIDALGISVDIDAGETETVTVNAPAGTYEYYCNVPGHKPAGMVGVLTAR